MRRRLTGNIHTGIGNPSPEIFDNEWTSNEKFNEEVKLLFGDVLNNIKDFSDIGGFDFKIELSDNSFKILIGLEPTYQHDPYICYCISNNKDEIYIHKGKANGYYGSDIVINEELNYREGMCTKEFMDCINKHYDNLMECMNG